MKALLSASLLIALTLGGIAFDVFHLNERPLTGEQRQRSFPGWR
jgi:hypothetical protein